ncbi:MAG: T9SS type A sorting domain-containing protein [Cyclobacteriaceae bacterium]
MKRVLALIFGLMSLSLFAQSPKIKDNPILRQEFEFLKVRNPATGKIPDNIRTLELEFASEAMSRARTEDASLNWTHRGPFNVGGRTRALAVDIDDENIILAGGVSGGMWRTIDQGATWTKVSTSSDLLSVTCIAQDPVTHDTWYYGTGEWSGNSAGASGASFRGDGLYKSIDNGLTWSSLAVTSTNTPESFDQYFDYNHEIVVNPANGDVLVANSSGIQRSQDGGTTFTEVLQHPNRNGDWSDIVTTSTGILYTALGGVGVSTSVNNGDTWSAITLTGLTIASGDRIELAIAPSAETILYVIAEDNSVTESHSLWKYDDGTDMSTNLTAQIPMLGGSVGNFDSQGGYDLLIQVKPDDANFVIIGGTNLYRSTDGFATTGNTDWVGGYSTLNNVSLYTNQHPDQHAFIFLTGTKALSGNDGGVQITNDITNTTANGSGETVDWVWLNNGYLTTQVYALSVGPGDQIMSGFQDNSTWLTTSPSSTATWSDQFSGDGAYNAFSDDGIDRYVSAQRAVIYRQGYSSADSETPISFTQIDPDPSLGWPDKVTEFPLFITPFYLDLVDDNILYLGGANDLFVNTSANTATSTVGWKSISLGNTGRISEFGLTKANRVYVGTEFGELYRVDDPASASPTLTDVKGASFPAGYISGIGANPLNEDEVIVTFSNYEVLSIFHTNNGGTTWTNISGDLEENADGSGNGPSVRAARIVGGALEYYVGTSTGLYSTKTLNGSSTNWVLEGSSNIGNVVVNHIVTRDDGQIVIGTHGNGLYSAVVALDPDLTVSSLDAPESMPFTGAVDVLATVTNNGGTASSSFDLSLKVNNSLIVTDMVVSSIGPKETYQHTFSEQFDFSALGSYNVEIEVTEASDPNLGNNVLLVEVLSEAAPTEITLSNATVPEDENSGASVGTLSTTDEDDTAHTYTLVTGEGDTDNANFSISTSDLLTAAVLDFETKTTHTIRVQTEDDDGNTFAKSFSITVTDVLGIENLDNAGITMFPNPFKDKLSLEMVNEYIGLIGITVYSLDGKEVLLERSYDKQSQRTTSLLDLRTIPEGNYIVKFNLGGRKITTKLIKE